MARKSKNQEPLEDLDEFRVTLEHINREKGEEVISILSNKEIEFEGGLSSGSLGLDYAINKEAGGMKWGQLLQLYGKRSGGKTTLALGFAAECTKVHKKWCIFLDLEGTLDHKMAINSGVDPELFIKVEEDGREAALIVERLMRAGNVGLVIIDSLAWWEPEVVPKKGKAEDSLVDFTQPKVAYQGSFLTQVVKKLTRTAKKTGTVIIGINQIRGNLDPYSGEATLVPYGPHALDHAISVQALVKGKPKGSDNIITDSEGNLIGQYTKIVIDKNKTAVPMKEAKIPLIFGVGVNKYMEIVVLAQQWGVVTGAAGNFKWAETQEPICRGSAKFVEMVSMDEELYNNLRSKVIEVMGIKYQND